MTKSPRTSFTTCLRLVACDIINGELQFPSPAEEGRGEDRRGGEKKKGEERREKRSRKDVERRGQKRRERRGGEKMRRGQKKREEGVSEGRLWSTNNTSKTETEDLSNYKRRNKRAKLSQVFRYGNFNKTCAI